VSIVDERTGIVTWDISSGSDDYMLLVLSVLQELCGSPNSDINKINDFIKALQDRILFLDDETDFPPQGSEDVLYILKNDTATMKTGTYIWDTDNENYKYFNKFNGSEISYDNTESVLESGNVQDAIDEIVELNENNVKSCGDYIIGKTYKKNDIFKYNNEIYLVENQFTASTMPDYSKVYVITKKGKYDHFEMEINSNVNSNPTVENGGIKYSGGCENFTQHDWVEWLGYRPCIMSGQGYIENYLDPYDYSKDINGNNVDITSAYTENNSVRNVMIKYKRIGLISQQLDYGKWIIRCTNDPCDGSYLYSAFSQDRRNIKGFMVGAYNGCVIDEKLHSLSDATILSSGSLSTYRTLARANGIFYDILDIKKLSFLKHLFILQNATINGTLMSSYDTENLKSGFFNDIGMNKNDTSTRKGKFLGLETNGYTEVIDGCMVDSDYRLKIADSNLYNDNGTGYIDCGKMYTLGTGYMSDSVSMGVEYGIIANNISGTKETFFHCETKGVLQNSILNVNLTNLFSFELRNNATTTLNGATARLCFDLI
jgi:hypothetical protein